MVQDLFHTYIGDIKWVRCQSCNLFSGDSTCETHCCSCGWKEVLMTELEAPENRQQEFNHHHRHLGWLQFLPVSLPSCLVRVSPLFHSPLLFSGHPPICHLTGCCAVWCRGFFRARWVWLLVLRSQFFQIHSHDRICKLGTRGRSHCSTSKTIMTRLLRKKRNQ